VAEYGAAVSVSVGVTPKLAFQASLGVYAPTLKAVAATPGELNSPRAGPELPAAAKIGFAISVDHPRSEYIHNTLPSVGRISSPPEKVITSVLRSENAWSRYSM